MKNLSLILSLIITFGLQSSFAQYSIEGIVSIQDEYAPYATIEVLPNHQGTSTDTEGKFKIQDFTPGVYTIITSYLGYKDNEQQIEIIDQSIQLEINLDPLPAIFDQIVVTGTKTFKRQTQSPVVVNVLTSKVIEDVQACNLSEGLKFQPGLRVETDCQTCNYTQLRMNGLAGGYSQILVNGRPIFSPLTGLYGLEQLPANMIERVEVIRGGGSSLYGSSAIGGTVNVITKIPSNNNTTIDYTYQNINGRTSDHILNANTTIVSKNEKSGVSLFLNKRNRGLYDHNGDQYSEMPELNITSLGLNAFLTPTDNQKLEFSLSNLTEYRYGGEMVDKPAYLTQQSEERNHDVWMSSLDYQNNFNQDRSSIIMYVAAQLTNRDHYTGIFPDDSLAILAHLSNAPYGISEAKTLQTGVQFNHRFDDFLGGQNTITIGGEYLLDDTYDEIEAYQYLIDQTTKDIGLFVQSDWSITKDLTLLSGLRVDQHNLVEGLVVSPRVSALYKVGGAMQLRLSYGTGFRAPQAFDTDLHIAFAGGGISRVSLASNLQHEKSNSLSASINYDKVMEDYIAGLTIEGFRTRLDRAFILQPIGEDAFGEVFEKQNGSGATVQGLTIETRVNYNSLLQLESGLTIQSSLFDDQVQYFDEQEGFRAFVRTPNTYGFANLSIMPKGPWNANINYVLTGPMKVPHFGGAPNQLVDEVVTTKAFSEWNAKVSYTLELPKIGSALELYVGGKNITNSYQDVFDIGKNRDSNFVYGPSLPRTWFAGIKWKL